MRARWWESQGEKTRCGLCFHACALLPGQKGYCGVRRHEEGEGLVSPYLGLFCSAAVDPIEKKPLYHWRPGTRIFSLGSIGCTMRCPFCQNHTIAQPEADARRNAVPRLTPLSPDALVEQVATLGLNSVAFTYNEPTLQAEYILEAAPLLDDRDIAIALVTNAMMGEDACKELATVTAAANIDLKTFSMKNYRRMGGDLATVQRSIRIMLDAGVHVELTTLVVPGLSDDEEEFACLADFAAGLSPDIPLHISRYFPACRYTAPATPLETLQRFARIALGRLRHVHLGNVH